MSEPQTPTARTRVVREAERGVYDRETVYRILDEGFFVMPASSSTASRS